MNARTLELIARELSAELVGRRMGRIFQLGRSEIAFDLRLLASKYLYIDLRPPEPSAYLITRRLKDLERTSGNPLPFALMLRKKLSGAEVTSVQRLEDERVLRIGLNVEDEFGSTAHLYLIIQLTGRSANLFLTDESGIVRDRARDTLGPGQQIGDRYAPPDRTAPAQERSSPADAVVASQPDHPSEALEALFTERSAESHFQGVARSAEAKVSAEIRKRQKLVRNLNNDLAAHGNADEWKRLGDLLLANVSVARREGDKFVVTDYFDESLPEISIEADQNDSITEAAEKYFRRYTKARNAAMEISDRLEKLNAEIADFERQRQLIKTAVTEKDLTRLEDIAGVRPTGPVGPSQKDKRKTAETGSAARRFISSDGFEILVGKRAKDNDVLTFKMAKSLDTWMHAADYPGSHVVIRNPNRVDIPQRTLHEAARLAAFYSQGKAQVKAAVHYTQKKFVNKPRGAAPGLVSLASFKTLLVEPGVPEGVQAAY